MSYYEPGHWLALVGEPESEPGVDHDHCRDRSRSPAPAPAPARCPVDALTSAAPEDSDDDDWGSWQATAQESIVADDKNARIIDSFLSPDKPARLEEPGALLHRLLLTDDVEEPDSPSLETDEARPRPRERSPSEPPKPKKMPRRKARPPPEPADLESTGMVLMASKPKAHASPPPYLLPPPPEDLEENWRRQQLEACELLRRLSGGGEQSGKAMEVLARHSSRLGPEAAKGLEEAVRQAVARASEAESFLFLSTPDGQAAFTAAKTASFQVYSHRGRTLDADKEVRWRLGIDGFADRLGDEAMNMIPSGASPPPPPTRPNGQGELMLIPISQLRFAHNDQSEHFVHTQGDCSILQLAVELIAGITPLEAVPVFNVCCHERQWYARSGNRRLAALALAALFAPDRIHSVWVRKVHTDATFLRGNAGGGRPKLTTSFNGEECQGRWLVIKQTGEVVGVDLSCLNRPPYGADLLMLLPRPAAAKERHSGSGDEEVPELECPAAGGA